MATQTAPDVDSIEHLDHEPECESTTHVVCPRADVFLNQHGCGAALICSPCLARLEKNCREAFNDSDALECCACHGFFHTFEALYQVVPL